MDSLNGRNFLTVSLYIVTDTGTDFTCLGGQSSKGCENIPDATLYPIPNKLQEGGCIIMPIRGAQLGCR
jgi:hypothetical protein